MQEIKLKDKYYLKEYETDILMFEALDEYLNKGYKLIGNIHLCPIVSNSLEDIILSYLPIDINEDILKQISNKKDYDILVPDYRDTILNVIAGIRRNYGYSSEYIENKEIFDKKYKNCIILLLDGMGVNILENNLDENSFLRRNYFSKEHAIYPSTTAASTTSTCNGLTPLESGWTGWANYIREMNREIELFTGKNYFTGEQTGRTGYDFMPWKPFYHDMDIDGYMIFPDFSKEKKDINDCLNASLKKLANGKPQIQYVYFTEPDALMHEFGPYDSIVKECLRELDKKVEAYASKLPKDTLLIISADHGHIGCNPIHLYACKPLLNMLNGLPSNDARCIVFRVKDGMEKDFEFMFQSLFGSIYRLMKTKDAIEEGYFGNPNGFIHERIKDFLGNYVAMATNEYYFNYVGPEGHVFKSHHAGITKEEMEVPLIIIRK